ncbi:hypothetical protein DPV78_009378 [Talaromyces pinophilus]|nr:hypothetical protein DPV78_009378 [Talaromyces pinophilus]
MTRLPGRLVPGRAQNSSARSKFRKHKVILESVTQKRKKLRTILSFEAKAPPGYTFIPAGNPTFTTACKEFCREQGLKIFTVTTTPHQNTHGLSQQVHRVGYHFPSTVVAQKCMELGLYISENGNVVPFEQFGTKSARTDGDVDVPQITINTEARDVIRDLFPRIPDDDINQIIKTAFQKGQRKVGTAVELPLARRAQLAVVAHVRHLYTDYDKLLKTTSFHEARRLVEDSTLEKLVHWRGDDEGGMPELEDVFREVIVISDDEEEDTEESDFIESENAVPADRGRDLSVEVLSSQVAADKLDVITNDDSNHIVSPFPIRVGRKSLFNDYNFGAGAANQPSSKTKVDRRGFSRYRAWDRAMDRYREKALSRYDESSLSRAPAVTRDEAIITSRPLHRHANQGTGRPLTPIVERTSDPSFRGTVYDNRPHSSDVLLHKGPYASQGGNRSQAGPPTQHKAPDILHFPDGSVFSKITTVSSHKRNSFSIDVSSAPVFVGGPRLYSEGTNETTLKRVHPTAHRPPNGNRSGDSPRDHTIIPSIERRDSPISTGFPLQHRTSDPNILPNVARGASASQYRRPLDELSKRIDLIDLTEDTHKVPKRRRLDSQEVPSNTHRSSSYRDEFMGSEALGSRTQPAPLMKHKCYYESVPQGKRPDMAPIMRTDPASYIMNRPRQETTDQAAYHLDNKLHAVPSSVPRILLDSPEAFNGSGSTSIGRLRVDNPQYRNLNSSGDSYVAEPPKEVPPRTDHPVSSHHSRGAGSDDAMWRSKANSYGSQRKLLAAQDPTWLTPSTNLPHPSLPVSRTHRLERVTHSPAHTQEDFLEPVVDLTRDATPDNTPQYYGGQRRISSQPPVFDGQRKRDALPASAVRRYEVQLEKSLNPHRYGSAPYQERQ